MNYKHQGTGTPAWWVYPDFFLGNPVIPRNIPGICASKVYPEYFRKNRHKNIDAVNTVSKQISPLKNYWFLNAFCFCASFKRGRKLFSKIQKRKSNFHCIGAKES
jgi:hypothetical protein